jgi:hypothetical protein
VQRRVDNQASLDRMKELKQIIDWIDFRQDSGFMEREEYLDKRRQLQAEIEALRPIDYRAL